MPSFYPIFYEILSYYESTFARIAGFNYDDLPEKIDVLDPIYGEIPIDRTQLYLMSLPIVERLSRIRQLAMTYIVYIGANHTRLEHSIGTSYLLKTIIPQNTEEIDKIILQMSGLLHDLGHSGWGHSLDSLSGYITGRMIEVYKTVGKEYTLYSPTKLDMLITTYLLYENYQIINSIKDIVEKFNVDTWCRIDVKDHRVFRDILMWVISEEEEGYRYFCKNHSWLKSDTTKDIVTKRVSFFQELLGREINCDRIDWVLRDTHHAFQSSQQLNIQNIETLKSLLKQLKIEYDNGKIKYNKDILNKIISIRDTFRKQLYLNVYEGIERSFADSLLTRLAYSTVILLEAAGKPIASPLTVINVVMGYLFSPDEQLAYFTEKVLETGYHHLAEIPEIDEKDELKMFLKRSYLLYENFFRNLKSILLILAKNVKNGTKEPVVDDFYKVCDFSIGHRYFEIYFLDCQWLVKEILNKSTLIKQIEYVREKREQIKESVSSFSSKDEKLPVLTWCALRHLFEKARLEPFSTLGIIRLEKELNRNKEPRYTSYILVNYYFFNRLSNDLENEGLNRLISRKDLDHIFIFLENLLKKGQKIDSEILGPYIGLPILFLIMNRDISEWSKKDVENLLKEQKSIITEHMLEIIRRHVIKSISARLGHLKK
jgi:HD superfamily phosphohydrolase